MPQEDLPECGEKRLAELELQRTELEFCCFIYDRYFHNRVRHQEEGEGSGREEVHREPQAHHHPRKAVRRGIRCPG